MLAKMCFVSHDITNAMLSVLFYFSIGIAGMYLLLKPLLFLLVFIIINEILYK